MDVSEYDMNHVYEILSGAGSWFGAKLLRLIADADGENRAKLGEAFPNAVSAYWDWYKKEGRYAGRKDGL